MADGVPVVVVPAEIDASSVSQLQAILAERNACGHATVVVDMTGTRFCDSAGLGALMRAHERAVAAGGEVRLVVPADGAVPRLLTLSGLDQLIPLFASVPHAVSQLPASPPAAVPGDGAVADRRGCAQCGAEFVPQREHARFCGAGCRADWNHAHLGDHAMGGTALAWSLTAMRDATGRLPGLTVWEPAQGFAAIGEAVWRITMVDGTLVRNFPGAYEAAISAQGEAERRLIEGTLGGLRFVRNRLGRVGGPAEVIHAGGPAAASTPVTSWTWKPVPPPLAPLPRRGEAWERARHRAYQAYLAGHPVGGTFRRAATFLTLTGGYARATMTGAS